MIIDSEVLKTLIKDFIVKEKDTVGNSFNHGLEVAIRLIEITEEAMNYRERHANDKG